MTTNYEKYRGRCKELSEELVKDNPSFTLVRGHYYEPMWNREEPHWWCVDENGTIHDPSKLQFPSAGCGVYTEYSGFSDCEECGKSIPENEIIHMGRYTCCSSRCAKRLVGL